MVVIDIHCDIYKPNGQATSCLARRFTILPGLFSCNGNDSCNRKVGSVDFSDVLKQRENKHIPSLRMICCCCCSVVVVVVVVVVVIIIIA